MGSGYIKVNATTLNNQGEEICQLANKAQTAIDTMYEQVRVLDTMWEGPANETFVKQFVADYESFKSICNYVKDFAESVKDASNKYDRCENQVEDEIRSLKF